MKKIACGLLLISGHINHISSTPRRPGSTQTAPAALLRKKVPTANTLVIPEKNFRITRYADFITALTVSYVLLGTTYIVSTREIRFANPAR